MTCECKAFAAITHFITVNRRIVLRIKRMRCPTLNLIKAVILKCQTSWVLPEKLWENTAFAIYYPYANYI